MSISDDLQSAIERGDLLHLPMHLDSDPQIRTIVLSKEVQALVLGPYRTRLHESRANALWAEMESFVREEWISICLTPKKAGKDGDFGLLGPTSSATWDMRSRKSPPSLRVIGRFYEVDTFVALTWWPKRKKVDWSDKEPLGDDDVRWRNAISECDQRWWELLPNSVPIAGQKGENYVSAKFHIVGP